MEGWRLRPVNERKKRTNRMGHRRRVALAVDDSPGAMRAVRYAAQSILSREDDVVLVTAVGAMYLPARRRRQQRLQSSYPAWHR